MKGAYFLAAAAVMLVSASPPELDSVVAADAPAKAAPAPKAAAPRAVAATGTYPPCTATRTDRCTQVRSSARAYKPVTQRRMQLAMRAGERG